MLPAQRSGRAALWGAESGTWREGFQDLILRRVPQPCWQERSSGQLSYFTRK